MIRILGKSNIAKRATNEDRFVADSAWGIALVADGMGGPAAGEIAASIVASQVTDQLDQGASLPKAIYSAHLDVLLAAEDGRGKVGMGSTVVVAHFSGHHFELAWIGDSRAYLWDGELRQISRDHSQIEMMISRGEISYSEAAKHPRKNIITRAIGHGKYSEDDVPLVKGALFQGQKLLLCSDGLHDAMDICDIARILDSSNSSEQQLEQLIATALANYGADNITAVLVESDAIPQENEIVPTLPVVSIARVDGYTEHFPAQ
ncbi:protein phosphatase 2C domain-containing protein [uncultured Zhongshania sp.]|uniref:PP2C family protein-serine/threonine phosphatase n=1 Tax=uncultured Zhongshania sp. TaxID=1642288 RepID=UPI0025D9B94B|nr:protein phosphatase 2C domain-containing protein [uncultured Zhongshania sp.]